MSRKLRARVAAAIVVTGVLVAPARAETPTLPDGFRTLEELFGTVLRNSKWPDSKIPVCVDNLAEADVRELKVVQDAVAQTWEANSKVRFVGWHACADPRQAGLHITITPGMRPHTKAVGVYLNARKGGMVLSFDYGSWRPACVKDPDSCIKAVAVHEFGHALGFTHEQLGPDRQPECTSEPEDILGDYLVTKYDPSSIMSYCNPKWNGDGKLSKLDEQAVATFYGAP